MEVALMPFVLAALAEIRDPRRGNATA